MSYSVRGFWSTEGIAVICVLIALRMFESIRILIWTGHRIEGRLYRKSSSKELRRNRTTPDLKYHRSGTPVNRYKAEASKRKIRHL